MKKAMLAMVMIALAVTLFASTDDEVARLREGGQSAVDDLLAAKYVDETLLDRVCAQKDCRTSRLFWFTDLERAKAAARNLDRPILALHLLGRLDEELSCANSRFFRTLLYSDESISGILRDRYVLYWHSVRPVPRITIEMGDGRVIHQTITGNSAHYLLDAEGEVLDVLPGLYSPAAFREQLEVWSNLHRTLAANSADRAGTLLRYHEERLRILDDRAMQQGIFEIATGATPVKPTAADAAPRALTKAMTEIAVLRQLEPGAVLRQMTPERWFSIGEAEMQKVVFAPSAIALMRKKQPITAELLRELRRTVASDTAYNDAALHRQIHQWFIDGEVSDLESLDERVYRELFLTPSDDPWMGLKEPDVFTAIGI
jgi:hypothetical protein